MSNEVLSDDEQRVIDTYRKLKRHSAISDNDLAPNNLELLFVAVPVTRQFMSERHPDRALLTTQAADAVMRVVMGEPREFVPSYRHQAEEFDTNHKAQPNLLTPSCSKCGHMLTEVR